MPNYYISWINTKGLTEPLNSDDMQVFQKWMKEKIILAITMSEGYGLDQVVDSEEENDEQPRENHQSNERHDDDESMDIPTLEEEVGEIPNLEDEDEDYEDESFDEPEESSPIRTPGPVHSSSDPNQEEEYEDYSDNEFEDE